MMSKKIKFGQVYVLYNYSIRGFVKVGKTTRTSEVRAHELSKATGVPGKWLVAYDVDVPDISTVEKGAHILLHSSRDEDDKELFQTTIKEAITAVMRAAGSSQMAIPDDVPPPETPPKATKTKKKSRKNFDVESLGNEIVNIFGEEGDISSKLWGENDVRVIMRSYGVSGLHVAKITSEDNSFLLKLRCYAAPEGWDNCSYHDNKDRDSKKWLHNVFAIEKDADFGYVSEDLHEFGFAFVREWWPDLNRFKRRPSRKRYNQMFV